MIKKIVTSFFFVFAAINISFAQRVSETAEVFVSGKFSSDKKASMEYLYTKTFIKDTLIENINFKKFQWDKFKNYKDAHEIYYEFERFTDDEYTLLDKKLKIIHKLKPKPEPQTGILYGAEREITFKSGKDASEVFSLPGNDVLIRLNIKQKKFGGGMNGYEFIQIFTEGVSGIAANILSKNDSSKTNYNVQPGDELQFVYRTERVSFSSEGTLGKDKSFKTEEKKLSSREEIITMTCTSINSDGSKKNIQFNVATFSSEKNTVKETSSVVTIDETGSVFIDGQMIAKEQTYKLDFRIDSLDSSVIPEEYKSSNTMNNFLSFTGVTYDTLSGKPFAKALYINSMNYYSMYYLCYFPMVVAEYPGTKTEILYVKLNNKEYGSKR